MEKEFIFYDSEVSKLSLSGETYWSEKPDLTILDNGHIVRYLYTNFQANLISISKSLPELQKSFYRNAFILLNKVKNISRFGSFIVRFSSRLLNSLKKLLINI
jgi:hypothetical protein